MVERQKVIRSLVDKVVIYADGNVTVKGLIEVEQFDPVNQKNDKCHLAIQANKL
jgi:hypothetical protein